MFRALMLEKPSDGMEPAKPEAVFRQLEDEALPDGDVTVRIDHSTWHNRSGAAGAAAALSPHKGVGLRAAALRGAKVW